MLNLIYLFILLAVTLSYKILQNVLKSFIYSFKKEISARMEFLKIFFSKEIRGLWHR
jgi:hypothetical protein